MVDQRGLSYGGDTEPMLKYALAEVSLDDYQSLPHTLTYGAVHNLAGTTVTRAVDTGAVAGTAQQRSISGLPFKFNPPLHNTAMPVRLDFSRMIGSASPDPVVRQTYRDELDLSGSANTAAALKGLRLGRIVQHEMAAGMAATNPYRCGFRFLYNPTSVTITSSRNDSMILDPQSAVNSVVSGIGQNFQTISFQLLLYRQPDVMSGSVSTGDYMPGITSEDLAGLRKYGTHYDLEYLYRVCNGVFDLEDRGRTSDIGYIVPSNARLMLGPGRNLFGFVQAISWADEFFNRDMIPVRTKVDIVFRRHVDMASEELSSLFDQSGSEVAGTYLPVTPEKTLDTSRHTKLVDMITGGALGFLGGIVGSWVSGVFDGGDDSDDGGGGGGGGAAPTPTPPTGGSVPNSKDAPVPGYNTVTTGWYYSSGSQHGGWDYGSGGINGKPVHCTRDGVVTKVKSMTTSYGNHVVVKSGTVHHYYCHLSKFADGLAVGQSVTAGTHLGFVGSTGNSSGPHLHYEERENDKQYSRRPQWAIAGPGSKS